MPKIKTKPKDIIRKQQVMAMINKLRDWEKKSVVPVYKWKGKDKKVHSQTLWVNYPQIVCLICLLYLFGKRISEVLKLKRGDVWTKYGWLYVKFYVLKRKEKVLAKLWKTKRVSVKNQQPFTGYIINWVNQVPKDVHLFHGNCRPHVQVVRSKKMGKTYEYKHEDSGHMARQTAYKILKCLNPEVYPHWFRHSLATQLAEEHFDPIQLKQWFDWKRFDTAMNYIMDSGVITEPISRRKI